VYPATKFKEAVARRAQELAGSSDRPAAGPGIVLGPLSPTITPDAIQYSTVAMTFDRPKRLATLVVRAPDRPVESTPDAILAVGVRFWPLRAFRELDDAILRLRVNDPEIGTVVLKAEGDPARVLEADAVLLTHALHWAVREIRHFIKRTLKRVDLSARSFFAFVEPGNAFAGTLFELALAADRAYMLDDPDRPNTIALSGMNAGPLPMSNGLTRLEARFYGEPNRVGEALAHAGPFTAAEARDAGLVTFAPDDIDWDDEVRLAVESRAAL
jgi:benzoyl-CoA-dihydrodiol lyase